MSIFKRDCESFFPRHDFGPWETGLMSHPAVDIYCYRWQVRVCKVCGRYQERRREL